MSIPTKFLLLRSNITRSLITLLTLENSNPETLDLIKSLIDDVKSNLDLLNNEIIRISKISTLFDAGDVKGQDIINSFYVTFLSLILLDTILHSNKNLNVKILMLSEIVTNLNPNLEKFLKLFDKDK